MTSDNSVAPRIPRDQWRDHPHFQTQALLLGSHDNFRRISRVLCDEAEGGDAAALGRLYRRWISAMRSHESYEEHKLYPYLAHRFGLSFATATEGHRLLHTRDREVRDAIENATEAGFDSSMGGALRAAFQAHDDALGDHLRLEEDLVIPLLLELPPAEFLSYYTQPIEHLLASTQAQ